MFSSQGSGWILRKVYRLEIKKAAFARVPASKYIALPGFLNGCRSMLNKRYHFDHNFFVYCFVAAYHTKNRINLPSFTMDLLHDENTHHYVLILNLVRFVAYLKGIAHRAAQRLCRNCFHCCTNRKTYQNHVKICSEHAAA